MTTARVLREHQKHSYLNWEETRKSQEKKHEEERQEARQRWLRSPSGNVRIDQMMTDPREEDAPDAHITFQALTRLTGPTVQIVILHDSPNGPAFDAEGNDLVALTSPPSTKEIRRLLQQSVSLSDRRIVFTLLDDQPPSGWQRSAHLRQHRLLLIDQSGSGVVGNFKVTLDQEQGVRVTPI
jgi:hypothetical protein